MKINTIIPMLIMLLSLTSFSAFAVPPTVSYQGYLTDPSGSPVDANVDIIFSLYDTENTNINSWQETQTSVAVSKGLFNVQLGSVTSFVAGQFDVPMWLGIQVGADAEMSPRQPLNSVGYALKAEDAETLAGHIPSQLDQSAHVTDAANPHNVTAAQAGAASITALGSHTSSSANPHNVTAAQAGAASASAFSTHSTDTAAHHARYQDSEAVSAMAAKTDSNPLHHDKYSNAQAVAAIKADAGIGLNADTVDNLHANEIIDAARDEVRIPIPVSDNTYVITQPGSYYLTGNKTVSGVNAINIQSSNVTLDLMGFSLFGDGSTGYGVRFTSGFDNVVIKNGAISGFGNAGIYSGFSTAHSQQVIDIRAVNNGVLGSTRSFSGIVLAGNTNRIERCLVAGNGGDGLFAGSSSIIHSNTAKGNSGTYGIYGGSGSQLNGNTAYLNTGIYAMYGSNNSLLTNNAVYNNTVTSAIFARKGSTVQGNTVYFNTGDNGLRLESAVTISGNTVYGHKGFYGIYSDGDANITNNTVSGNANWGVWCNSGCNIIHNTINNNNYSNIGAIGGLLVLHDSRVKGNLLDGNLGVGIFVNGVGNILDDNHVTDSSTGIFFQNNSNLFRNNTLNGNSTAISGLSFAAIPPASRNINNISW